MRLEESLYVLDVNMGKHINFTIKIKVPSQGTIGDGALKRVWTSEATFNQWLCYMGCHEKQKN